MRQNVLWRFSRCLNCLFSSKNVSYKSNVFLEDLFIVDLYILRYVLSAYGNTHTLTSQAARQTTFFRNEARQIIKNTLNATHEDACIFVGVQIQKLMLCVEISQQFVIGQYNWFLVSPTIRIWCKLQGEGIPQFLSSPKQTTYITVHDIRRPLIVFNPPRRFLTVS